MTTVPIKHWRDGENLIETPRLNRDALYVPCFNVAWETSPGTTTKDKILRETEDLHKAVVGQGAAYCRELVRYIVLVNLHAHFITTKEIPTMGAIFEEFDEWWGLPKRERMASYRRWISR